MIAVRKRLISAEQYLLMPHDVNPTELVRGRIETMMMPAPRHGYYCGLVFDLVNAFVKKHALGRVVTNDSGVITERAPDSVRGADVAFYSYKRVGRGKLPKGYFPAPPELVFEVRSPSDRMGKLLKKIGEYLAVGVDIVCLLDPDAEKITVFEGDLPPRTLRKGDTLDLPKIGPGLRVAVTKFFDED